MSKSIKLKDNTYIDSTGIVHNKTLLSEILQPNIITAYLNNNTNITLSSTYTGVIVPMERTAYNIGSYFTLANGKVKISKAGYYKISANMIVTGSTSSPTQIIQLMQNTNRICSQYVVTHSNGYTGLSISPRVFYANAGDEVSMQLASNIAGTYTVGSGVYTYLTVEKI